MTDSTSLGLLKSVINTQKDLIVVFQDEEPILTSASFNSFFGVSSFEEYKTNFGPFLENFVPHPSYFHKDKLGEHKQWFDALLDLPEDDRLVSMMTQTYEPHAFSVTISEEIENYRVVTLCDITQTLIKRIMIENNANLDKRSGAYDKKYFSHIAQSYEDAAVFNEKIIALTEIVIENYEDFDVAALKEFVIDFKYAIRKDDMLVRWADNKFLLVYIIDDETKANQVTLKLKEMKLKLARCSFSSYVQTNGETIKGMLRKLS